MTAQDYEYLVMEAHEAFIRRASQINLPFMLKGSYVTRQYFQNPTDRIPADLDWVYMETLEDEPTARQKFNEWARLVTELDLEDNVAFRSFKENEFWRSIDYAMADDFPTVNTDLLCFVNGKKIDFCLDISFNLDIEQPPVPLMYKPLSGEPFLIPNTVPISLQVSWKIHQTLIRPRFKDLFDLMHLVQHPAFDKTNLDNALQALINECSVDNVDLEKLKYFLNFEIEKLFPNNLIVEVWNVWRHNKNIVTYGGGVTYDSGHYSIDVSKLPADLTDFLKQFEACLQPAGLGIHLFENLPKPTRDKRKSFEKKPPEPPTQTIPHNPPAESKQDDRWTLLDLIAKLFK